MSGRLERVPRGISTPDYDIGLDGPLPQDRALQRIVEVALSDFHFCPLPEGWIEGAGIQGQEIDVVTGARVTVHRERGGSDHTVRYPGGVQPPAQPCVNEARLQARRPGRCTARARPASAGGE